MELCENCHVNPATVHLTQTNGVESSTHHYCEECCEELGLPLPGVEGRSPMSTDETADLEEVTEIIEEPSCPRCGTTRSDFTREFIAGCSRCYEFYEAELIDRTRRLHGPKMYKGKQYRLSQSRSFVSEREVLEYELAKAVQDQRFEVALVLRDRIRDLKNQELS